MINIFAVAQTKAFARQDGAFLSLLWIAAFACTLAMPEGSLGSLITMTTPFFVAWRMFSFRDYALDGYISYRKALYYCVCTFFYASLIFAVAQFIYFRFIDSGQFMNLINMTAMGMVKAYKEQGVDMQKEINDGLALMMKLKPLHLAFVFMMYNIMVGGIMSVVIAYLGKLTRRKK